MATFGSVIVGISFGCCYSVKANIVFLFDAVIAVFSNAIVGFLFGCC